MGGRWFCVFLRRGDSIFLWEAVILKLTLHCIVEQAPLKRVQFTRLLNEGLRVDILPLQRKRYQLR